MKYKKYLSNIGFILGCIGFVLGLAGARTPNQMVAMIGVILMIASGVLITVKVKP